MSDLLAPALSWKYDDAQGISTSDGVLTGWPEILGTPPDETEQLQIIDEYKLFEALETFKDNIEVAMTKRIVQGIRWSWSAEEPEFIIVLTSQMREILASWHQLLNQTTPATNPHGGFIKSNNIIIKGPGDIDLPDVSINEIAEFAGLWVSEICRIAINQKSLGENMTLQQLESYNASEIDWTVSWSGHPDWSDDLILYNP